jgi:hypothetical protein
MFNQNNKIIMEHGYKQLRWCVFNNPTLLTTFPKKLQIIADSYLRYNTGIEIETKISSFSQLNEIYNLLNNLECKINTYQSPDELRIRLHSKSRGLVQLYKICEYLNEYVPRNKASGIHFHINAGNLNIGHIEYHRFKLILESKLDELKSWNYKGKYNKPEVSSKKGYYIRICESYNTIEFRIMYNTYDYKDLLKHIIHAQSIVKRCIKEYKNI